MATDFNSYYGGISLVDNIPVNQRLYDRPTALLTKIAEGRAPMMRILLNTAKAQGGWIAQDVKSYWGIEERRKVRMTITGDSTSTSSNKHDILTVDDNEAARLQPGDLGYISSSFTAPDRSLLPKQVVTAGATPYVLNELVKVLEVEAAGSSTTGKTQVVVVRNFGGIAVDDATLEITAVSAMSLVKMVNSIAEGADDMQIYSDTDDEDYNWCQIVGKKWGDNTD